MAQGFGESSGKVFGGTERAREAFDQAAVEDQLGKIVGDEQEDIEHGEPVGVLAEGMPHMVTVIFLDIKAFIFNLPS
jgi:hypothetical protein